MHDRHASSLLCEENVLHTARSTPNTSMSLDAFGNVTNAVDTAGNSWQFSYAANSILTNEVFTSPRLCDSACQTNALARRVDDNSRPIGYDLAIGDTPRSRVRYGYDTEGRIATLAATNAAGRGFQVAYTNEAGYSYGSTLTTPNAAVLARVVTRDPYRRSLTLDCTTRFDGADAASFAYAFDAADRPVTRNGDRFAYDELGEVVETRIGTNTFEHAYDRAWNHTRWVHDGVEHLYLNNSLNQTTQEVVRVLHEDGDGSLVPDDSAVTNKLTWSAQGGLQRDGRFIYAFDAEDQLASVTSATLTNGAIRVVNAYDYRHRRISKTVYTLRDDSPPTSPLAPPLPIAHRTWYLQERHDFVYDDWNLIHETVTTVDANSTTNVAEIEYFWGADLSNTLQGAGGVGGLLAVSQNGQFYFPVYDNLGNIVKYLNESGTIVASYTYDDFGRTLSSSGSMSNVFAFRFSTKYFEKEVNLYCYGERYYWLAGLSWLSRDPLVEGTGPNLYKFCDNLPTARVDVHGEFVWAVPLAQMAVAAIDAAFEAGAVVLAGYVIVKIAGKEEKKQEAETDVVQGQHDCSRAKGCIPCNPPVGSIGYRVDVVPPSLPHFPFKGTHTHLYIVHQRPREKGCDCFWHKLKPREGVDIPKGAVPMAGKPGGGGPL